MASFVTQAVKMYDLAMEQADPRVADWFMMQSPLPSFLICLAYFIFVALGPTIMAGQKPMEMRNVLVVYNITMVGMSTFCFVEDSNFNPVPPMEEDQGRFKGDLPKLAVSAEGKKGDSQLWLFLLSGWMTGYSLGCQPVDYSNSPQALRMARVCWWFYISKFIELFDTVFFIMRKKFNQVSFLHVFHHGIMPFSWWFGVKFVPGGFGTFHAMLNSFIHLMMYTYYGLSALGPAFSRFLWWKKYMTSMQITQFIVVFFHSMQLFFMDCSYPILFVYWIGSYAIVFLVMFAHFYIQTYQSKSKSGGKQSLNGQLANGKDKSS